MFNGFLHNRANQTQKHCESMENYLCSLLIRAKNVALRNASDLFVWLLLAVSLGKNAIEKGKNIVNGASKYGQLCLKMVKVERISVFRNQL
jgi:hypothetical protein